MHKVGIVALVGLLAFGLAGCGEEESKDASAPVAGETETTAPLVAESSSATDDADVNFLLDARTRLDALGGATTIPNATDEQLISAGHLACETLKPGDIFNDLTVIEGELVTQGSYLDSSAIATAAILYFCPELSGTLR